MNEHDRARWRRVRDLFDAALERPAGERQAFVEEAAANEPTLAREVQDLLDAHESPLLDDPIVDLAGGGKRSAARPRDPDLPPIGRYEIHRSLGRGGMGEVFEARRTDPEFENLVALKLLRRDLRDGDLDRRFRTERRILASLDHPYIARLIDGGRVDGGTEDGRPFLVMEHVEGVPIDRYCDAERLDVDARLLLVGKVCEAVQTAHRSLIVHRDLKPANILVTADGEPKLLDFGIAKLLESHGSRHTVVDTEAGRSPMTFEFASPEQLEGRPITTAVDIWALGVLLYTLLTGSRPFRLAELSTADFVHAVCERDPPPPSKRIRDDEDSRAIAEERRTDPRRLARSLEGDLDAIVAKALEKDPRQRYGSAAELAADLERYRKDLPVVAGGTSLFYRVRKFSYRHRWSLAAGATILAGLITFTSLLIVQTDRIRWQRDRAEAALALLTDLFRSSDPAEAKGTEPTLEEVLARGVELLPRRTANAPELRAELASTLGEIYLNLGLLDRAAPLLEEAVAVRRQGSERDEIARSLSLVGRLRLEQGRYGEAIEQFEQARTLLDESEVTPIREQVLSGLSEALRNAGQARQGFAVRLQAIDLTRRLYGPQDERLAAGIAGLAALEADLERHDDALASYRRALELYREIEGETHPAVSAILNRLGLLHHARGEYDQAIEHFGEADRVNRRLYKGGHPKVASVLHNLAESRRVLGQLDAAAGSARRALSISERLLGPDHPDVADSLDLLGRIEVDRGRFAEAETKHRQALAVWQTALHPDHPLQASGFNNLAHAIQMQGRLEEAESLYREALARYRSAEGEWQQQIASVLNNLGTVRKKLGDLEGASSLYEEALAIQRRVLGEAHSLVATSRNNLANVLLEADRPEAALPLFERALPAMETSLGEEHPSVAIVRRNQARALAALGRLDEAEAELERARLMLLDSLPPDHLYVLAVEGTLGEVLTELGRFDAAEELLLAVEQKAVASQGSQSEAARRASERLAEVERARGRALRPSSGR